MELSADQNAVVVCDEDCIVLACPGSGKTRVIVKKVARILKDDPGAKVMIVSFTKDSASEIKSRVVKEVGEEAASKIASGTFHSISLDQLRRADSSFKPTIIGAGQIKQYVQRALNECKITDLTLDDAVALIEEKKMDPEYDAGPDQTGKLFGAYTKLMERNNVIDFADMLSQAVRKMRDGVLPPKDCKYLLTDESQDIDAMQFAWCVEHIKNGAILTAVGDDDQSIYRFRRALGYDGMMRFVEEFEAKPLLLGTNYRCHAEILDAAAKVIQYNTERVKKDLIAARGKGGAVKIWDCKDNKYEANFIIGKILESCEQYQRKNPAHIVHVPPGEWAVLTRNNHNLRVIQMAMQSFGIPHIFSGKSLWDDRPVCLVLSLLSSLVSGKKDGFDMALHFAGIDEGTLTELHKQYGQDFSALFYGSAKLNQFGEGTAATLKKFIDKVPQWSKALAKERDTLVINGAFDWFIDNLNSNSGEGKNTYAKDRASLEAGKEFMCKMNGDLSQRLFKILYGDMETEEAKKKREKKEREKRESKRFGEKEGVEEEGKPGVLLSTLHGSKGLEFKNVWMAQMDDGVIPSEPMDDEEITTADYEEERRLFYVGMTRAKDTLHISYTKAPSLYIAETGYKAISIFGDKKPTDEDAVKPLVEPKKQKKTTAR